MGMIVRTLPLKALKDNYIWLIYREGSKDAWVVDPGDAIPVNIALDAHELNLAGILITHHHYDHTGGVQALQKRWKNSAVYGSHKSTLPFITHPIREGDQILCSGIAFRIMEIPGHTLDHTAYFNSNALFSGDTLFSMGCGKMFEGTPEQMYHSLNKLKQLPDTVHLYCGHEYTLANLHFALHVQPDHLEIRKKMAEVQNTREQGKPTLPSRLYDEKKMNPFLRCDEMDLIKAVEKHCNKTLTGPIEVFSQLREWKNHYQA